MSDRPMHTVPGLFDRLTAIYADGERAIEEGRLGDAVALFTEGIQLDDQFSNQHVTMYAQRAFARQRMGDNMGAIPDYGRAIEMEPPINQAQYLFHRGMCFTAIGGHEEHAVNDYGRSIAIYPDHPGPYHLRGKLYASDLGRYQEAIADFDRLLAMRQVAEGYQLRGYSKLNLGRGRDAIPDLLDANRLEPDTYTDYLLAWAGAVAPDDELFYLSLQAVLAADPGTYKAYFLDNEDFARFRNQPRFLQLVHSV
jgi:tetratricopeptide (TPR) repeat protein